MQMPERQRIIEMVDASSEEFAALAVAPLHIGRGIRNTVLEAMALARPVLVPPAAVEGIHSGRERSVPVAAETDRLAEEVLGATHSGLEAAARRAVLRFHDWRATLASLAPLLETPEALKVPA